MAILKDIDQALAYVQAQPIGTHLLYGSGNIWIKQSPDLWAIVDKNFGYGPSEVPDKTIATTMVDGYLSGSPPRLVTWWLY